MSLETVQAVRQAELEAVSKQKDARRQKEEILKEAQIRANNLLTDMVREAEKRAEYEQREASKRATEIIETARMKAEKETQLLRDNEKEKEQSAIKLILSTLIEG